MCECSNITEPNSEHSNNSLLSTIWFLKIVRCRNPCSVSGSRASCSMLRKRVLHFDVFGAKEALHRQVIKDFVSASASPLCALRRQRQWKPSCRAPALNAGGCEFVSDSYWAPTGSYGHRRTLTLVFCFLQRWHTWEKSLHSKLPSKLSWEKRTKNLAVPRRRKRVPPFDVFSTKASDL